MRVSRVAPLLSIAAFSLATGACTTADRIGSVEVANLAAPIAPLTTSGAERLHRLDIMLMVTALRCRTSRDDFTREYHRFAAQQLGTLDAAAVQLRDRLVVRYGPQAGEQAFERLGTRMANNYGGGHPWLGCRELKQVARNLAQVPGRATLEEAADQLVARHGTRLALSKR